MTIPKKLPVDIIKNKKLSIGYDPKLYTELMLMRLFQKSKCKLIPMGGTSNLLQIGFAPKLNTN